MKLIIQIPCFNEASTLAAVIRDLPRAIPGIDTIEYLVVDDGSSDETSAVAWESGVHHVVRHNRNLGLARAFQTGVEASLAAGADIIVNTDGDNQYSGADIPLLVRPIVCGTADIVLGTRQVDVIDSYSRLKRILHRVGGMVLRRLSGLAIPDAVTGFRALSRRAAMQINILSSFSYTLEMLIQAGHQGLAVAVVPTSTNSKLRESRLFKSVWHFVERSATTMLRSYAMYKALRTFAVLGFAFVIAGSIPIIRFLYFVFSGDSAGHIQSLIIGGILINIGIVTFITGIVADLVSFNRMLIEKTLLKVRELELGLKARSGEQVAKKTKAGDAAKVL